MKQLAQQTKSSWYKNWAKDGITRRSVRNHLDRAYHQAVERAPVIRFSLDEIDDVAAAVKAGRSGFRYGNTSYKRLYRLGYGGRFGIYDWPCAFGQPHLQSAAVTRQHAAIASKEMSDGQGTAARPRTRGEERGQRRREGR
jgi:hypothetical protein